MPTAGRTPGWPCRRRRSPPRRPVDAGDDLHHARRTGRRAPAGRRRRDRRPETAPYGRSRRRRAAARASSRSSPASRASRAMQRSCHRLVSFFGAQDQHVRLPQPAWCAHSITFSSWAGLSTRATVLMVRRRPRPARCRPVVPSAGPWHPAQLLHRAELAVVDLLHAVAEGRLDGADVADQALQALRLDRGGLVGAPHGAVEGDVPLDEGGAEGDGGQRGLQARSRGRSSRSARSGTRPAGC